LIAPGEFNVMIELVDPRRTSDRLAARSNASSGAARLFANSNRIDGLFEPQFRPRGCARFRSLPAFDLFSPGRYSL